MKIQISCALYTLKFQTKYHRVLIIIQYINLLIVTKYRRALDKKSQENNQPTRVLDSDMALVKR